MNRAEKPQITRTQRTIQVLAGVVIGAVVGLILSIITDYWLWLPLGAVNGLLVGAVTNPNSTLGDRQRSSGGKHARDSI